MSVEQIAAGAELLAQSYARSKVALEQSLPFDADWLHLAFGPLILLAAAQIMRESVSSWRPWLVVFALAVLNEIIDVAVGIEVHPAAARAEAVTDLLLTLVVPTAMVLAARRFGTAATRKPD